MNEELKAKAVALVLAMAEPTLSDTDVAWQGVVQVALPMYSTDPERARALVDRLRKMAGFSK